MLKKRMMCLWLVAAFIAVMGFNVITFAGDLEPSAPPAPTMKTLDQIYNKIPTPDDGAWSKLLVGDRFNLVMNNEAVVDHETHLVWERSPSLFESDWPDAFRWCWNKVVGGRRGWRLPTVAEMTSLLDDTDGTGAFSPLLRAFVPVESLHNTLEYWTSTSAPSSEEQAVRLQFAFMQIVTRFKTEPQGLPWCVRGGQ